ncbi:rod shape-determining protein MreC [Maribellus sp. YY47]|uniref:rod shape-determining protein MreC n=1 Tax=Maribellus sp. YY47 TaxID=2929486 RepID=UPI0020015530|nr:rod shape-determining protein MreC [Maribellus sp. YY47]MCK3686275.1 rod shape-determining protein MreC [Maribellus sp. YY47]
MRSLFRLLVKNYPFLLFLFLEVISVVFIVNYNSFQRSRYLNTSNAISASLYSSYSSVVQYFGLKKVNKHLMEENALLRNRIDQYESSLLDSVRLETSSDSTFRYIPARVVNNSVNRQQNYITLNRGRKHGVKPDQGIISSTGIVGIVTSVSESYSMGLSVLNPRWSISAKLKKNGYYGSLIWNGKSYKNAELGDIPFHVDVAVGDTIVTSGYSSVFPEGILVGKVESFTQPPGENYYVINVELSTDFKSVTWVEVIDGIKSDELEKLKQATFNGEDGI